MNWQEVWQWTADNWGSLSSVAGLVVSLVTLFVATKAKQAAEAARAEARRRNLAEELQDAHRKAEQVGLFLRDRKWELVFLRGQEVSIACNLIHARWSVDLDDRAKERILQAQVEANSIAEVANRAAVKAPTDKQHDAVAAAQRRLQGLLTEQLGLSLGEAERGRRPND